MNEIEDQVIARYSKMFSEPDRKEESIIRNTTKWAIQEYIDSENYKDWQKGVRFMSNPSSVKNPIWWYRTFRIVLILSLQLAAIEAAYRLIVYVFK
jgi:hypothetical protein